MAAAARSGRRAVTLRWGFGVVGSSSGWAKVEFEVRFGRASVGLEMEREMGKHLEPHIVPSRFQLI